MLFSLAFTLLLLPQSVIAAPTTHPPSSCHAVTITGCVGTYAHGKLSGSFSPFTGSCPGANEGEVYKNGLTGMFLYRGEETEGNWVVSTVCGPFAGWAYGQSGSGSYPFVASTADTGVLWNCNNNGFYVPGTIVITCSHYSGEPLPCNRGTHSLTGSAPDGICGTKCPAHRQYSRTGSTTMEDCFTPYTNMYVVSDALNRIVTLNADKDDYRLITEGVTTTSGDTTNSTEYVDRPYEIEFITETTFLVSMHEKSEIMKFTAEGDSLGTFARVTSPYGILFLPEFELVAIASFVTTVSGENLVYFFNVEDASQSDGAGASLVPLLESDAVGVLDMSDVGAESPRYLSRGENPDEILITTDDNKVVRFCVPTTDCTTDKRVMVKHGGQNFKGIAKLDTTFLVVDRGDSFGKIYECSLTWGGTNTYVNDCAVFADMPEGTVWDPYYIEVDAVKQLVYAVDRGYNIIHTFDYSGEYMGHLTNSLVADPTALAIRPGPLPSLSSITPASSLTAGVPFQTPLTLRTPSNSLLPPTYPIEAELYRYQITTTGFFPGTTIASTVEGTISFSGESLPSNALAASLTIPYVGDWTVSVTEGIVNPQTLLNGTFEVTVYPAPTEPAVCEAEFERVLIAGDEFSLEIITTDAFGNPTTGAEFSFSCCNGEAMTKTGEYMVHVTPAIKGNPFRFDVFPAAASADRSEHNIKAGTELVSKKEVVVDLRVFPKDAFNNTVAEAAGYAVKIDRGGEIALTSPDFDYEHVIEAGFEGSIEFVFTLNGEEIRGGGASIKVKKPEKEVLTKTNIYIGVFGLVLAVVIVLVLKMLLDENTTSADVMTKGAEMASIAKSMGTNILDPVTDFTSWFLVIRKCGGWVSNVYLFFVMVAFVTTWQSVRTSVKQLNFLSKDNGGGKLATHQSRVELPRQVSMGSAELDEVFVELRGKYPEQNAVAKKAKGVLSMFKKGRGTVAPVLDPDPADETAEQNEKMLLGIFRKIEKVNRDIGQRERKEERVSGAVLQVFVEDIPGTVFNALYVIYGCVNLEEDDEEGGAAAKMLVFLLATFLSVALGVKKFLEWRQIKADRRNVESWIEIVELRLVDAKKLLRENKGEMGDAEAGKDEIIERLEKENQLLKERGETYLEEGKGEAIARLEKENQALKEEVRRAEDL